MTTSNVPTDRVTTTVDTSGLLCPMPVYEAARALGSLQPGEVLELICTDPGALADIPALARQRGDVLIANEQRDGTQVFWIEGGAAS